MKKVTKKIGKLVGVLALGVMSCLSTPAALAAAQDFTLHNETGKTVKELYINPHNDDEWGEDVMGEDVLENDEAVEISFDPKEEAASWDMKVVFNDGTSSVWTKLQLFEITDITILYNEDGKPWATWEKVE